MNVSVNVSMGVCANISFFQISKAWMRGFGRGRACKDARQGGNVDSKLDGTGCLVF